MPLTAEQRRLREGLVTASFLPYLMTADPHVIHQRWLELIGDPGFIPEDFSDNWPVQFGSFIESFAVDWHQRRTGQSLTRRGEVVRHPGLDYFCCTLDAWRESDRSVLDCKACNAFSSIDSILSFYAPQIIGQVRCTNASHGGILLLHGGAEPIELQIDIDPDYEREVWTRVRQFWDCVQDLREPTGLQFEPILPPDKWRVLDLDHEPDTLNWKHDMAAALEEWLQTEEAHKRCEDSKIKTKDLLPADVGRLYSGGAVVSRSRSNAVTIRRRKDHE